MVLVGVLEEANDEVALYTGGDGESDVVLNLQPQRIRPSLNSHTADLFAPAEGCQRILNSSSFSHEPSVSGFQPFVRPKDPHSSDELAKRHKLHHVISNVASSSNIVNQREEKKAALVLAPGFTLMDAEAVEKEEGEWSDVEGSADAFLRSPIIIKQERPRIVDCPTEHKQGMAERASVSSSGKAAEKSSRDVKWTEGLKDEVVENSKGETKNHGSEFTCSGVRDSDDSVKGDTSIVGQEEASLAFKQRDVKGAEVQGIKPANNPGKKLKHDPYKEAQLGKKRSRQTVFLNLEELKQAGPLKSSTPRRQAVSSTLTARAL
ncbi:hypothetical protein IFM89_021984 [Coptis chinensis]|uniref:Uncharacterized protein n=1 Tax=Coptis chinensis TaxID=261450 RepID=A0A835M118_9MAGN|nr:hypothetical protein IFM89_021984 [Coptis chinensis]